MHTPPNAMKLAVLMMPPQSGVTPAANENKIPIMATIT
jgi:hypothetical protein